LSSNPWAARKALKVDKQRIQSIAVRRIKEKELQLSQQSNIERKLKEALKPERLEVINESHLHAGHQPQFDGKGESHFRVRIVAEAFTGKSRLERHQMINQLLADELKGEIHALAVEAGAPGEPTASRQLN
jgi:BolA family transcriptional regulator, general stress-responsive regulator